MTTLDKISEVLRADGYEVSDAGTCLTTFGYESAFMLLRVDIERIDLYYDYKTDISYAIYTSTDKNNGEYYISEISYWDNRRDGLLLIKTKVAEDQKGKYEIAANLFRIAISTVNQNDNAGQSNK